MLSMKQSLPESALQSLTAVEGAVQVLANPGTYLLTNEQFQIATRIPRSADKKWTACMADAMFDRAKSIPASYIVAFEDVLRFRESHRWPIEPADLSSPHALTVLEKDGPYELVMFADDSQHLDASGKAIFGCGGIEYYRVNSGTGQVLQFNGCVEGGGVPGLPRLSRLPE
jgi:hypothetical protein